MEIYRSIIFLLLMKERLVQLTISLCETLPFNITIYEQDGLCQKPQGDCIYRKRIGPHRSQCNKITYTQIEN